MPKEAARGPEKKDEKPKAAKGEDRGKASLVEDEGIGELPSLPKSLALSCQHVGGWVCQYESRKAEAKALMHDSRTMPKCC